MDIGLAVRNLLVYGAVAIFVICATGASIFLYTSVLHRLPRTDQIALILVIGFVVAGLFIPLHNSVKALVDSRIFKGRYDPRYVVADFGNRLMRCYGWREIAQTTAQQIADMMQSERILIYLADQTKHTGEALALAASTVNNGGGNESVPAELKTNQHVLNALQQKSHENDTYGVAGALDIFTSDSKTRRGLEGLGATVAFPIRLNTEVADRDALLGAIFLGEPSQENTYTREDLRLLRAMTFEAAVVLDNTRLHEDLLASHRHYRAILQHMQRGVLAVDTELNIITMNEAAADILAVDRDAVSPGNLCDMVPEFVAILENALAGNTGRVEQEVAVVRGERTIPCGCETSSLGSEDETGVTGALIVFEDLTEQKRFQERVRRMDRLASVGTLAAGMAHEIKNPLVSLKTFTQLLPERYSDPEFQERFIPLVADEVNRINRIVQNLLEFARPRPHKPGKVDIKNVLERTFMLLENRLEKRDISVRWNEPNQEEPPFVYGDSEHPGAIHNLYSK